MTARALFPALCVMVGLASQAADADDINEGRDLYLDFCAACHGVNLEGVVSRKWWKFSGGVLRAT